MNISVNVIGVDKIITELSKKGDEARIRADRVTETYARKMANQSAGYAPVDSGDLRANIIASPRRINNAHWEYGSNLAYARRQEYENRTHKGFIRRSVWNNRTLFREALRREVAK